MLTQVSPEHPSFHVVALSLPGYGFSQAPRKTGFTIAQYAEVWSIPNHIISLSVHISAAMQQADDFTGV
jgi:pimeloyl-ACP methyl ester carboxylesterase